MTRFVDALRTVPRVDKPAWTALPLWTRWAIAARASVLGMTLVSALIGGLAAVANPQFSFWLWLVATVGLMAAHASNNLINDWVDSARGLDAGDYHRARYGTHVLRAGLLTQGQMMAYVACTAGVALAAAAISIEVRGAPALWLALAGAFFLVFYTWPLKSLGMGEPAVLLVWGPLMTAGTCLVASGEWNWGAALLGTVYALGPTAVLFGKHIDKLEADAVRGVRTVPVMLGGPLACRCVVGMIALQLAAPALLALLGAVSMWLLLVLLAAPLAWRTVAAFTVPCPLERPADYPAEVWPLWYAHHAFALTRRVGALLVLALVIDAVTG